MNESNRKKESNFNSKDNQIRYNVTYKKRIRTFDKCLKILEEATSLLNPMGENYKVKILENLKINIIYFRDADIMASKYSDKIEIVRLPK